LAERYVLNEAGQPAPYVPPVPPGRPAPPSEPEKPFQVGDRLQIVVTVRELIHRGGDHWNVRLAGADVDFWQPAERLEKIARRLPRRGNEEAVPASEATSAEEPEPDRSEPDSREQKKARMRPPAHKARLTPAEAK
jgi:hypothetical protein